RIDRQSDESGGDFWQGAGESANWHECDAGGRRRVSAAHVQLDAGRFVSKLPQGFSLGVSAAYFHAQGRAAPGAPWQADSIGGEGQGSAGSPSSAAAIAADSAGQAGAGLKTAVG